MCKDVVDEGFSILIWTQLLFMTLIQLSRTDCDAIIFNAVLEFLDPGDANTTKGLQMHDTIAVQYGKKPTETKSSLVYTDKNH